MIRMPPPAFMQAAAVVMMAFITNAKSMEIPAERCGQLTTTYDMLMCYGEEAEAADREMHAYDAAVGKSLARLDPHVRSTLGPDVTNDAFTLYRKVECTNAGAVFSGGSMASVLSAQCYIELTRERTHRIWKDFIALPAMGPPALPEPR